jgi:hypothetical protein
MLVRQLSIALALLGQIVPAHAITVEGDYFLCEGVLKKNNGEYAI